MMNEENSNNIIPFQFFSQDITGHPDKSKTKPDLEIVADAPIIETEKKIIAVYLGAAVENEEGIKADYDTEFLHDYRVNLRKIRSVLSLFKEVLEPQENNRAKQDFAEIMRPTNRLRDLDVYLLEQQEFYEFLPVRMHPGLQQMFTTFVAQRKQQLQQVKAMLNSKTYQQSIERLQDYFCYVDKGQAGDDAFISTLPFARKIIYKHYNKIARIARKIDLKSSDKEIHQLRIECKKLRYLIEFFSVFIRPKKLRKLIEFMKLLQDNLGRFNDYSIQQDSLQEFLTTYAIKHRNKNVILMAESIGALSILLHQKQSQQRKQIIQSFSRFNSSKIKKKFYNIFYE
jgi:CHAD domain-containing protein